jgi:hypothetical protein
MSFARYFALALALTSTAAAGKLPFRVSEPRRRTGLTASSLASCTVSATSTITNPAGVTALAACETFSGNVVVQTGSPDANGLVDLSSVKEIDGDFVYQGDDGVKTIRFTALQKVSGALTFNNLTLLSTLDLSSLSVVEDITWSGLSSLGALGLSATGLESVGSASVTDTQINDLGGLGNTTKLDGIEISNNNLLSSIQLAFETCSGDIELGVNDLANGGVIVSFPNLISAGADLNIRNSTSVSLPSLKTVSGNLGFYGNYFTNLVVPNITSTKGLYINDNSKIQNISFPSLASINGSEVGTSGCQIANNTRLSSISGFPILASVDGGLDFRGNFTS